MHTCWNLPISSDGRYLAPSVGSRESSYIYLTLVAEATRDLDHPDALATEGHSPRRPIAEKSQP